MQCAGGRQIDAWRGAGEQQAESLRRCRSAAAALLPILAADRSCRTALGAPKEGAGALKAQARRKARTGDGLDGCGWPGGAAGSAGRGRGGSPNNSVSVFGLTESKTHGHPIQLPHHPCIAAAEDEGAANPLHRFPTPVLHLLHSTHHHHGIPGRPPPRARPWSNPEGSLKTNGAATRLSVEPRP